MKAYVVTPERFRETLSGYPMKPSRRSFFDGLLVEATARLTDLAFFHHGAFLELAKGQFGPNTRRDKITHCA